MAPSHSRHVGPANSRPGWLDLLQVFTSTVSRPWYGKTLLAVWCTFLTLSLVVLPARTAHLRRLRKQLEKQKQQQQQRQPSLSECSPTPPASLEESQPPPQKKPGAAALMKLLKVLGKRLFSRHTVYLLMYVVTLCTRILITVKLTDQSALLGSYMGTRNWSAMFEGQAALGLWFMTGAGATALMKFLEKRVALSVRRILYEEVLGKYLEPERLAYYHSAACVDEAPARMTTDLADFSTAAVKTLGHILKPSIDLVHLSSVIINRIGAVNLMVFLTFFVGSQKMLKGVSDALPKSLKRLASEKQALEAALRTHHEQLHTYREQVAVQGGTTREKEALERRFKLLSRHQILTMSTYLVIDTVNTYVLKYGGAMCGFSVLIPHIFMGDPHVPAGKVTAWFTGCSMLLQTLATEIKDLVEALTEVPRVQGLAVRIAELLEGIEEGARDAQEKNTVAKGPVEEGIRVKGLTVTPPKAGPLVRELEIEIPRGRHTVIRGRNGIGKTSFFRTLCGLWRPDGTPDLLVMPRDGYFAVSQDGYFPGDATLRGQIAYPKNPSTVTTEQAERLLDSVGLGEFVPSLDVEGKDWRTKLSGGQRQRLSWARMLHKKPPFALIDEGASALDPEGCDVLHKLAKNEGVTLVSISHHVTVDKHHDVALDFKEAGEYTVGPVSK